MQRGWIVLYKDGTHTTEEETDWRKVVKKDIKMLRLKWGEKKWDLIGKKHYFQSKRASIAPGEPEPTIDSRCIGYYEDNGDKVIYRVNERTGIMRIEVEDSGSRLQSNHTASSN